ncbi:Fic family protein [Candidatus Woesearchaeota archaeon]|nr:Fic family protein [Candidatus Woesearchaeota archaeon]
MDYINPELLIEIDEKKAAIENFDLAACVRRFLETESNAHSNLIDDSTLTNGTQGSVAITQRIRKKLIEQQEEEERVTLENLTNAWKWAIANYNGELNRRFVEEVAKQIEPERADVRRGYRTENVSIRGEEVMLPPRYEKVHDMMEELFFDVYTGDMHPIEKSALIHFHTVRIHPFAEGNGRTSRLLQNLLLRYEGYGPATIKSTEKREYFTLLRKAIEAYKQRRGDGNGGYGRSYIDNLERGGVSVEERSFFDYLAGKVKDEFTRAEAILQTLSEYKLTLTRVKERTLIFAVKRALDGYFRAGHIGSARLTDSKSGVYIIKGDIQESNIGEMVGQIGTKTSGTLLKYSVQKIK